MSGLRPVSKLTVDASDFKAHTTLVALQNKERSNAINAYRKKAKTNNERKEKLSNIC